MANTPLLGLTLPVTGTLSGTWGDVVNAEITSLIDSAVAGTTTLTTDANVTLTTTVSVANEAREAILLCTGARTVLRTITAPAQSKTYIIINATTGGQSVKLVGVGPTTGVTVANGERMLVAWNGADFVMVASSIIDLTTEVSGTLPVASGGTGTTTLAANNVVLGNGTSALQVVAPGATGNVLTSNGTTWTSEAGVVTLTGSQVLTNKTIAYADNTLTGVAGVTATQTLTNKTITAEKETAASLLTGVIDLSTGNYFYKTISADTTFTVSNVPANLTAQAFILELTNGGAFVITWFAGLTFVNGLAPTLTSSGRDVLSFFTRDGGTTWSGFVVGKNLS